MIPIDGVPLQTHSSYIALVGSSWYQQLIRIHTPTLCKQKNEIPSNAAHPNQYTLKTKTRKQMYIIQRFLENKAKQRPLGVTL